MDEKYLKLFKEKLDATNYEKLVALNNDRLNKFVGRSIKLCNPKSVFICTDSKEDVEYIRKKAIENKEEIPLNIEGHTYHFDGPFDQGRDKEVTRYLVEDGDNLGMNINSIDREEGLNEVRDFLRDTMVDREMYVRFFCLGPTNSVFSIPAIQITDSAYVCHSEDLLYRHGYEQFKKLTSTDDFFCVLHSAGELKNGVSTNVDQKRIYIDIHTDTVYSVNSQYAGNTVGFKKLSLRLTIRKASRESWLSEHMFLMGVNGPNGRRTYFTGAFPSFCGKTSTSMIPNETILGDDIAQLRRIEGRVYAVNVECGIFGIIQDISSKNDPYLWEVLSKPNEVIFSNILVKDGVPYWNGGEREIPEDGVNYSGQWFKGKKDGEGNSIPPNHKNARYTISLKGLPNLDEKADDPNGVPVGAIVYGGRDPDTWVPVQQSFLWGHGVITMGASLESETTAATIGQEGVRSFQPMSNLDFLSIPLSKYIQNHIEFAIGMEHPPKIFAVNYFLRGEDGKFLNGIKDKYVWMKWIELKVHNDVEAIRTPTGYIPYYEDLKKLFKEVLDKEYTKADYEQQFMLRIPENLSKIKRIERTYRTQVKDTPKIFFNVLDEQNVRLIEMQKLYGDYISPFTLLEHQKNNKYVI